MLKYLGVTDQRKKTLGIFLNHVHKFYLESNFPLCNTMNLNALSVQRVNCSSLQRRGKKNLFQEINKFGDFKVWNLLLYLLAKYSKQGHTLFCRNNLSARRNPQSTINIAVSLRVNVFIDNL